MLAPIPEISDDIIATALALADIARETTRTYFRRPLTVDRKGDSTPVTIADRETEQRMRELIGQRHGDHRIVGEEVGRHLGESAWNWILDPSDGPKRCGSGTPS